KTEPQLCASVTPKTAKENFSQDATHVGYHPQTIIGYAKLSGIYSVEGVHSEQSLCYGQPMRGVGIADCNALSVRLVSGVLASTAFSSVGPRIHFRVSFAPRDLVSIL